MMRIVLAVVVVLCGALLGAAPVGAGPPERLSVTLTCDRGFSATAKVTFSIDAAAGPTTGDVGPLSCGGDAANHMRSVFPLPSAVTALDVTQFDVVSGGVPVSCADEAPITVIPVRIDCPTEGRGARLVVR